MAATSQIETSIQPGRKIAAAAVVLLAGLALAMMFRQESTDFRPTTGPEHEHLVLREQGEPMIAPAVPWPPSGAVGAGVRAVRQRPQSNPPTVLVPRQPSEPPPSLARKYPEPGENTSRWGTSRGMSMEMLLPRPAEDRAVCRHTIVDGDTLPDLARRYLGSPQRSLEIYEANRDALSSGPDVLPIGTVLLIPSEP